MIRKLLAIAALIAAATLAAPALEADAAAIVYASRPTVGGGYVTSIVTSHSSSTEGEWVKLVRTGENGTRVMMRDYIAPGARRTVAARVTCSPYHGLNRFAILDDEGYNLAPSPGWSALVRCA